ncbi:hypothetical protein Gotur_030839 [Gossypium turneri]
MSEQWVAARVKQKGDSKCIPWRSLRDAILTHPDVRKRLDVFALSIYGLVVFPKPLGHVDETVTDLFDQLDKKVTPILVDKVSYRVFSENYSPLKEIVATPRRDDIRRKNGWQFFKIFKRKMLSGELLGYFQMRSCIGVVIFIGFLYWVFGELLDMPHYWC